MIRKKDKIVKILAIAALALLVSGCSMHSKKTFDKTFKNQSTELTKKEVNGTLISQLTEKRTKRSFISTKNKTLSEALQEIGEMNNQNFMLKGEDFSIKYAPNHVYIKSFSDLKNYIEDTTNKTLVIKKNKFAKDRIKVVRVLDKEELKSDLSNMKFSIQGQDIDLRQALQRFSAKTSFSIIFTDPKQPDSATTSTGTSSTTNDFRTELISFSGANALQFLTYIEKSLDLYVDIDYENKIVSLQKYKLKTMPLLIVNRSISKDGNTLIESSSSESSSGESGGSIQSSIEYSVYTALITTTNSIVERINARSGANNLVSIDENTGIVSIYATSSAMKTLLSAVKKFNKSYSASGVATITVYELIVSNGLTLGSDATYSGTKANGTGSVDLETSLTQAIGTTIQMATSNVTGSRALEVVAKSLSELGYIAKKVDYGIRFRNHVPSSLRELRKTNYVKNTSTDVVAGDDTTSTTSTETEEIVAGSEIMVIPKIYEDTVSLYLSISDTTIEDITKETFGTTEINIPITKPRSLDDEFVMRDGEMRFIRSITQFEDADSYKGLIPIQDFVIGGEKEKSLVRKELIYVLSVELDKN